MIHLKPIPADLGVLDQSHLFRGARLILGYVAEHGPLPLTPSKAFKRVFVNWAAEAFVWPHWTIADLYRVNKVLNEYDFGPLEVLHHVLVDPPALFAEIQPYFLFNVNHAYYSRSEDQTFSDWETALNILNVEAENGISLGEFCDTVFGRAPRNREQQWHAESELYTGILRPLCWAGLLDERRSRGGGLSTHTYQKTPLWSSIFALKTDSMVRTPMLH